MLETNTLSKAQELSPAAVFLRTRGSPGPRAEGSSFHTPARILHQGPCPILALGQGVHILQHCWWVLLWAEGLWNINPMGMWSAIALRRTRAQVGIQVQCDRGHPGKPSGHLPLPTWAAVSNWLWAMSRQALESCPDNPECTLTRRARLGLFYCFHLICILH